MQSFHKILNAEIDKFITKISEQYELPKQQLKKIWQNKTDPQTIVKVNARNKIPVLEMLQRLKTEEEISKDADNHYIHKTTSLIFCPLSKKVIGKKVEGVVRTLTAEDIEVCKQFKFDYELPLDLSPVKMQEMEQLRDDIEKLNVEDSDCEF